MLAALAGVVGAIFACSEDAAKSSDQNIPDRTPREPLLPEEEDSGKRGPVKASAEAYAQGLCAFYAKCDPGYLVGEFGTLADCPAKLLVFTRAALDARGSATTQANLDACLAKLGVGSCADDLNQLAACEFHGTLDDGATCSFAGQCKSGSCFYPAIDGGFAECGRCTPRAPLNADCTNAECAAGFICVANKCIKPGEVNDSCDDVNAPCRRYLQCSGGRCAPQALKDQACDDARSDACDFSKNLLCIPNATGAGGICREMLAAKVGEKCGWNATNRTQTACIASACSTWDTEGTCLPYVGENADCSAATGGFCALMLTCKAAKCVPYYPASCQAP